MQQSRTGNLILRSPTGRHADGPTKPTKRREISALDKGAFAHARTRCLPATVIRRGRIQSSLITRKQLGIALVAKKAIHIS